MADTRFQYIFKIIIVGNTGVGKSSLLLKYTRDIFSENYEPTIGVDFGSMVVNIPDSNNEHTPVKLQIWDTAGQERFRTITKSYYKNTCGVIIVFDLTNKDSFNAIPEWIDSVKQDADPNAEIILIGNKADLDSDYQVTEDEIDEIRMRYDLKYFETSAHELDTTSCAFNILGQDIFNKVKESQDIPVGVKKMYDPDNISLDNFPYKKKKKRCCI
jgi:small GTP-binding protein